MLDESVQNNKLIILGKLTASLLHEIRNPLSAVKMGLTHLKMMDDELPEDANETVQATTAALERLQHLVDDVLDFSRKSNSNESACCINQVTEDSITIIQGAALKAKIIISKDLTVNLPTINFNKNKLLQIFVNLITNSLQACEIANNKSEHYVKIKTFSQLDGSLTWEIYDNGIGISEENKEKIFNDFYTNKNDGTGLGLSICNYILNEYESKITFHSEIEKGTTFTINFNPKLINRNYELQNSNH